jgi:phosphatidylglycerol:prolipoprotein diacylglycerol transferase
MINTKVPLYGIFILISLISGLIVIYNNSKSLNYRKEQIIGLLIYILLGAIFGAKYFTYFTNFKKYNGNFDFKYVGLSSYGAVIGIFILLLVYSKQYKKNIKDLIYIIIPSISLMYSIGKIGCFLAGCCYGIYYDGPLNVIYNYSYSAPAIVKLFPIQLLESVVFLVIFIYLYNQTNKNNNKNQFIGKALFICGLSKFLLDYLRMSHQGQIISINQIISLIFIIIGIFMLLKYKYAKDSKKY